jgi:hypothetical protein
MFADALALGLLLIPWLAQAFLASRFRVKYAVSGEVLQGWKDGTPNWIPPVMPWLRFLGWGALLGLVVWLLYFAHVTAGPLLALSAMFLFSENGRALPGEKQKKKQLQEDEEDEDDDEEEEDEGDEDEEGRDAGIWRGL